jgi:hypothetical protein
VVVQDAADGGCRGDGQALVSEVGLQGERAGVEAFGGELFAEQHDRGDDVIGYGAGVAGGASGSQLDSVEAAEMVALEESVDVLPREPIGPGCGRHGEVTTPCVRVPILDVRAPPTLLVSNLLTPAQRTIGSGA